MKTEAKSSPAKKTAKQGKLKTPVKVYAKDEPRVGIQQKTVEQRDPRMFFRNTNWTEWWEEFYLSLDRDGKFKYRTVKSFVKAKCEGNKKALEFMKWYLGPPVPDEESPYAWCKGGPQDWQEKRRSGGWFSEVNLKKFSVEIRRRANALDALREAGNGVTLHSLVRAEQLAQEVDRAFKGTMFLDDLSFEDNVSRADAYITLHSRILSMKAKAQDLYARSHGVNFDDMQGLTNLMQAAAISGSVSEGGTSRGNAALNAVVEMCLQKNAKYRTELPPGTVELISDVTEEVDRKNERKKSLN